MAARITRLKTRTDRLHSDAADELRQLIVEFPGLPDRARSEIVAAIDRQTASERGWAFVMIGPEQHAAVVRWMHRNSRYPTLAPVLWAELFTGMRFDTGEIVLTRGELAERLGTHPSRVSAIMGELTRDGALIRHVERGQPTYFMNPNVGTHLASAARDKAQAEAPRLQLVE